MDRMLNRRLVVKAMPGVAALPMAMRQWAGVAVAGATPEAGSVETALGQGIAAGIPGAVAYGWFGNEAPVIAAAGVENIDSGAPMRAADRFRIYSITKTFTAIVALQLVDEGKLDLDATVPHLLDDPAAARIPYIDRVTLRQLLNHTSGIYDYVDDAGQFLVDAFLGPDADWSKTWTPDELLAYADGAKQQPYFAPGKGAKYSNTNYILVGLIVEQATGRRFGDELRDRILTPLALNETSFAAEDTTVTGTVTGYQLLDGQLVDISATNLSWAWTAGGMVSTAADLARFADAVFAGNLVSAESFRSMTTFDETGEGMGLYGFTTPNGRALGMDGESAGFSSAMVRLPDADLSLVVLANVAPGGAPFEQLRDDLFASFLAGRS